MGINFTEEEVRVEYVVADETVRESVTGTLQVPAEKPLIQRVLEVGVENISLATPDGESVVFVEDGGVAITGGSIDLGVVYVAEEEGQPVHFFADQLALAADEEIFIEIPDITSDMEASVDIEVIDASYEIVDDLNGADQITVTVVIAINVRITEDRFITIITDVTGIDDQHIEKELVQVDDIILKNNYRRVVEGTLDQLDRPVERILRVDGGLITSVDANVVAGGGAVNITGDFQAKVLYVADEPTEAGAQPVYLETETFSITETINIPEVEEGMQVYADVDVENWSYALAAGDEVNGDQINVEARLNIEVKVTVPREIMAVVDITSDKVKIEKELIRIEQIVGENQVTDTIVQNYTLPQDKPNIQSIVEAKGKLLGVNCTVEDSGVSINGQLETSVLYQANDDSVHHVYSDESPGATEEFNSFVSVAGAEPGMYCYYDVVLKRIRATKQGDRAIKVTATLSEYVRVTALREFNVVTKIIKVSPVVDQPDEDKPSRIVYVVQPGDTLYKIAARYNTTVDAIIEVNEIENPDYIEVGQKLIIPKNIIDHPRG